MHEFDGEPETHGIDKETAMAELRERFFEFFTQDLTEPLSADDADDFDAMVDELLDIVDDVFSADPGDNSEDPELSEAINNVH